MGRYLFLLLLFAAYNAPAQQFYEYFNTDEFWKRLVVDTPGTTPLFRQQDTAIVVASTRARQQGNIRFMSEVGEENTLRYFFVYTTGAKWHVLQVPALRTALALMPHPDKDWVVYTEGMGKIFTSDLDRGMRMAAQYGVNVLLLDYPSIRSNYKSFRNYKFAINSSRRAYEEFVPVLDTFQMLRRMQKAGTGHVSLFFHSMGNNVMREIVRHNLLFLFNGSVWVDNLILNAACSPRRRHKAWVDKIHFARHIYIHFNPRDGTLKWARIAGLHQLMGEHMKRPVSSNAIYINFNTLAGDGHSNFLSLYSRPPAPAEAVRYFGILFHGGTPDLNDKSRFAPGSYRHIGLDILPVAAW